MLLHCSYFVSTLCLGVQALLPFDIQMASYVFYNKYENKTIFKNNFIVYKFKNFDNHMI